MKNFWAAVAIIAVVAGLFLALITNRHPTVKKATPKQVSESGLGPNPPPFATNSEGIPAAATRSAGVNASSAIDLASRAASPNPPAAGEGQNLPPLTVLDNARVAMHNYESAFGENPVGTNPEITAALMGKNPKGVIFITPESGLRVNEDGELVDGYGTPFFFHQLSGNDMEIRSAGEDRKMWTSDDHVTR